MSSLVSIITPCYNSERFIVQTIQSIQKQTHQNWELIIVDDCSTDKTVDLINQLLTYDSRIQLHQLESNSGAGVARNKALSFVKGDFVAFLDADDLWFPNKLSSQLEFMSKKKLFFTFSYYELIDEKGNALNIKITTPEVITYKQLFYCNWIGNLTGIYDVRFFGIIPISSFKKRQDWILWLEVVKKIKFAKPTPKVLAYYRCREDSISASKVSLIKNNFNVFRHFHKQSFVLSCYTILLFLWIHFMVKSRYRVSLS